MENDDNLKEVVRALQLVKMLQESQTTPQVKEVKEQPYSKLTLFVTVFPVAIVLIGAIFWSGVQTNKWNDATKQLRSEIRAEFIEKQSIQQDRYNTLYMDLNNTVKSGEDKDRQLDNDNKRLEERIMKLEQRGELAERNIDSLYRTQQYLKSLHNIKTPPE